MWNSPSQNTGVGILSLLQIFPTQGLNPGFLHCRWILHLLSHTGSPSRTFSDRPNLSWRKALAVMLTAAPSGRVLAWKGQASGEHGITVAPAPSEVSVSTVLFTHGQLQVENIKWKLPEINSPWVLNYTPFWIAWWNLPPSHPGHELTLCPAQPAPQTLSSHSGYQIHCQGFTVCVQVTLILLSNSPKAWAYWCWQFGCAEDKLHDTCSKLNGERSWERKNWMLRLLRSVVGMNLLSETVTKNNCTSFAVISHTAEVTATLCGKCWGKRHRVHVKSLGRVRLCTNLWTVACQVPLSVGFPRQQYWSGLPCPPPGDLPHPGIKPLSLISPILAGGFGTTGKMKKALHLYSKIFWKRKTDFMNFYPMVIFVLFNYCWSLTVPNLYILS